MGLIPSFINLLLETNDPKEAKQVSHLSYLVYMLVNMHVKAKSCISTIICASILEYFSCYVFHHFQLWLQMSRILIWILLVGICRIYDVLMWYVKIIIGRVRMSLKHFKVARFQSAECASNGGSLADCFMAFACGMSLILVGSLWQNLHWPKNRKFFQCFSEEPFMRFFKFRSLLLIPQALLGHAKVHKDRIRQCPKEFIVYNICFLLSL